MGGYIISIFAQILGSLRSTTRQHCRPLPLYRHMPMFGRHNIFDFIRWLTNIWLCRLRGVFSTKRPKYLGKSAYYIPTHKNLLYNGIYFHFLKCIPPPTIRAPKANRALNSMRALQEIWAIKAIKKLKALFLSECKNVNFHWFFLSAITPLLSCSYKQLQKKLEKNMTNDTWHVTCDM